MICPICINKLVEHTENDTQMLFCPTCGMYGNQSLWQMLFCFSSTLADMKQHADDMLNDFAEHNHSVRDITLRHAMQSHDKAAE